MDEDDFSRRLSDFEKRIRTKETSATGNAARSKFTQSSIAWRMVTELVVGMLLGLAIGYGLDSLMGTLPWFLLVFSLLGFAAGVRTMMRTAAEVQNKRAEGAMLRTGNENISPGGQEAKPDL